MMMSAVKTSLLIQGIFLVALACLQPRFVSADWGDYLAAKKKTTVYQGPDIAFPARTTLKRDQLVIEQDRLREFIQIKIPGDYNMTGWVRAVDLELLKKFDPTPKIAEPDPIPVMNQGNGFYLVDEDTLKTEDDSSANRGIFIAFFHYVDCHRAGRHLPEGRDHCHNGSALDGYQEAYIKAPGGRGSQ